MAIEVVFTCQDWQHHVARVGNLNQESQRIPVWIAQAIASPRD